MISELKNLRRRYALIWTGDMFYTRVHVVKLFGGIEPTLRKCRAKSRDENRDRTGSFRRNLLANLEISIILVTADSGLRLKREVFMGIA